MSAVFSDFSQGFWRLKQWQMGTQDLVRFCHRLLDLGVTTMDHAKVYDSEELFGKALKADASLRSRMQIVTKCGIRLAGQGFRAAQQTNHYDSSASAIVESTEDSLRALGVESIDVLLLHRPDYLMSCNEVAEAFSRLHTDGKVLHFGVSNFTVPQFALLDSVVDAPLVTNQVELSPLALSALDDGTLDQCQQYGVRPMLWSLLGGGDIVSGASDSARRVRGTLKQIQIECGADTIEQVLYAWALMLPSRPVALLGSSKIERAESAVNAASLTLTREQWYSIWESGSGHPVP